MDDPGNLPELTIRLLKSEPSLVTTRRRSGSAASSRRSDRARGARQPLSHGDRRPSGPRAGADLEWMVMPPILLNQYRVFHDQGRPVGVALWAFLSAEAEAKLSPSPPRLRPDD